MWHRYPWAYCELVKRPWVVQGGDDPHGIEVVVFHRLAQLEVPDDATAIKVVSLPFLETIEWGDEDTMEFLAGISQSDPEGLIQLLSNESLTGADDTPLQILYLAT